MRKKAALWGAATRPPFFPRRPKYNKDMFAYAYPFLLVTMDVNRNMAVGEMLANESADWCSQRRRFHALLPRNAVPVDSLETIVAIEAILAKMVCDVLRCNMQTL